MKDKQWVESIYKSIRELSKLIECEDHELFDCIEGLFLNDEEENISAVWNKIQDPEAQP